jgi:hypothetical protein
METDEHLTYAETSRTFNIPIGTLYALVCPLLAGRCPSAKPLPASDLQRG